MYRHFVLWYVSYPNICLLGALLRRNTVIDFLVLGCEGKRVNVICSYLTYTEPSSSSHRSF